MDSALDFVRLRGATDHAGLDRERVHDALGFADETELQVTPARVGSVRRVGRHETDVLRRVDVLTEREAKLFGRVGLVHERQAVDEALAPAGLAPVAEIAREPRELHAVRVVLVLPAEVVVFASRAPCDGRAAVDSAATLAVVGGTVCAEESATRNAEVRSERTMDAFIRCRCESQSRAAIGEFPGVRQSPDVGKFPTRKLRRL